MGAITPDHFGELMVAGYRAKDADAIGDLYEDDAVFANSVAGYTVVGRAAIVEKVKQNFDVDVEWFNDVAVKSIVVGDYASALISRRPTQLGAARQR
jgi:ketosteroid isomerase-like protein